MEGRRVNGDAGATDLIVDPTSDVRRRSPGETQDDDMVPPNLEFGDEVAHTTNQELRLAGPGTGHDDLMAVGI